MCLMKIIDQKITLKKKNRLTFAEISLYEKEEIKTNVAWKVKFLRFWRWTSKVW